MLEASPRGVKSCYPKSSDTGKTTFPLLFVLMDFKYNIKHALVKWSTQGPFDCSEANQRSSSEVMRSPVLEEWSFSSRRHLFLGDEFWSRELGCGI